MSNGHIYLLYTVDRHHLLYTGTPSYDPAADEYFNATIGRITRYTAEAASNFTTVDYNSRTVLLGESVSTGVPSLHQSHGVGSLVFGTDGTLMASFGDGASYNGVDRGPGPGSYGAQAEIDGIVTPEENIGAYRAQVLHSLSGKIVRIDPATGDGVASNPYFDASQPRSQQSRIWAVGVRNPYRMALVPNTGSHNAADGDPGMFSFGDVGWITHEELNIVNAPGMNFGWPWYEGMVYHTAYNNADYAPLFHDQPVLDWRTDSVLVKVDGSIYHLNQGPVTGDMFGGKCIDRRCLVHRY